jgi:DivIVA domain-containing protein
MMDLTPLEVRKKKGDFRRQIRGYDPATVDDFLDLVADRLEQVVRDNHALAEKAERLEHQVTEYREREKALTEALVSAQQMREAMRVQAVQDADQARSQAAREANLERTQAAQEADTTRQAARRTLEQAKEQAAREVEQARQQAERESRRILAELRKVSERESSELRQLRERESVAITQLQAQRTHLLQSYRTLLERGLAELEAIRREVEMEVADLVAPLPTAQLPVPVAEPEISVLGAPEEIDQAVDTLIGAEQEAVAEVELLLEEPVAEPLPAAAPAVELVLEDTDDDNAWLAELAAGGMAEEYPAPQPPPVSAEAPFLDDLVNESDDEFIDLIMAEASVAPVSAGASGGTAEPMMDASAAKEAVLDLSSEDLLETLPTDITAEHAEESGFDAMFSQDDDLADFDFDAALATATGFSSPPNRKPEAPKAPQQDVQAENVVDLGIDLNDTPSPLDLGRRSVGAFDTDEFGLPPQATGPTLSRRGAGRPPELTVRPLSPEEEAPDLPVEVRRTDDGKDDDMFSSMFGGRG